jgi:hypothetical protein
MNGRSQMQRGKNWILPKEINANRLFQDCHTGNLEKTSMGSNGGSVAMDSVQGASRPVYTVKKVNDFPVPSRDVTDQTLS